MANVTNLEKKLVKLIETEKPCAIALTGKWGVGKTHLWNEIRDNNEKTFSGKKYAYVSLFGLDSLASLKSAIAIEVHKSVGVSDSIWKKDILKPTKKFLSSLTGSSIGTTSDVRIGLNFGNNIITSVVFSHLKNTLVCLDDIERKSESLSMSEVLGLVNYLRNERKCQVLMIMHDEESDDKKYFDKHKEKVFDEVLVLDDSLSIIENLTSDIETFPIYEKLYQAMGVRNIRFYQRVQKIYQEIIKYSPSLSKLSKEEILRQILIIKLVNDIPKVLNIDMKELEMYFSEDGLDDRLDIFLKSDDEALKATVRTKKDDVEEKLSKFHPRFRMEGWSEVVIELITNIDIDSEKFEKLLNQDLINEQALKNDREKRDLMAEYRSLNPENNFNQRLFDNVTQRIDVNKEDLNNLSFHCNILRRNGAIDLANQLQEQVEMYISNKVLESAEFWDEYQWYSYRVESHDIFYDYLKQAVKEQKTQTSDTQNIGMLCVIFKNFHEKVNQSEDLTWAVRDINRESLKAIIWQPLNNNIARAKYIREILKHPAFGIDIAKLRKGNRVDRAIWHYQEIVNTQKLSPFSYQPFILESKLNEVKKWTLELLQERIVEKPNSKAAIENFLELTNNLESI